MTSRDFCFWLQGFFELSGHAPGAGPLTPAQVDMVRRHLALVFIHEIDPTLKQANKRLEELAQKIHDTEMHRPQPFMVDPTKPFDGLGGTLMRC